MALTKISIPGWLHQFTTPDRESDPTFAFFTWKSESSTLVPLQQFTIEAEIELDQGDIVRKVTASIQEEQAKALEEYLAKKADLDELLNKYLALPAPKAIIPDSEGGDDGLDPPNDGFAPDETSFG
jgi:hypothetical protein